MYEIAARADEPYMISPEVGSTLSRALHAGTCVQQKIVPLDAAFPAVSATDRAFFMNFERLVFFFIPSLSSSFVALSIFCHVLSPTLNSVLRTKEFLSSFIELLKPSTVSYRSINGSGTDKCKVVHNLKEIP